MARLRLLWTSALLSVVSAFVVACGGASGSSGSTPAPSASAPAPTPSTGSDSATVPGPAAAASGPGWTTYGGSASRAGVAVGAPAHPRLRRRFGRSVDGQIYAQPLVAGGRIYLATENNTVYAFTTGGRLVWKRHLGAPVPGGDLPCGNISPSGITGTPVITGDRIYVVAFLRNGHRHTLFGLRLAGGSLALRANVDPPNRLVEQQRGALLATHGRIYVPYGGLFGDCGPFRGYVVSTTTGGDRRISYRNAATEAGIWAPGGASAQSGTLLVSTGNGGSGTLGYENAVIRLSRGLRRLGFWAPTDWRSLSSGDVDTGSVTPLPVSGGRVFQIGKDGIGYLLRHSLGGVGGHLYRARVCTGGAFGAAAWRAPLAVVSCGGNVYALRVEGGRFRLAWSSGAGGLVPVIAGDSVFASTREGTLVQLRMSNGSRVTSADVGGGSTSFPAPAVAGRTLVAPRGAGFVVFSI